VSNLGHPVSITFKSAVPSKKNEWGVRFPPNEKMVQFIRMVQRGCEFKQAIAMMRKMFGVGITSESVKESLDRLAMQIPGDVRDLKLVHPEIEFIITHDQDRQDRDNIVTTILDLLVQYGVLADDSIKQCNGKMTIWPSEKGEYPEVTVVLIPGTDEVAQGAARYAPKMRGKQPVYRPEEPTLEFPDFTGGEE
jgi:hypothetical protein